MAALNTTRIRSILNRHRLSRIDITLTGLSVIARAIPDTFHPLVASRRQAALSKLESVTLQELEAVTSASMVQVGMHIADTIEGAVDGLVARLTEDAKARKP